MNPAELADLHTAKNNGTLQAAFQQAGLIYQAVVSLSRDTGLNSCRFSAPCTAVHRPMGIIQLEAVILLQQIHMSFPKAVNSTYISPVTLETVCEQIVVAVQHRGNHVFAEIMAGRRVSGVIQQVVLQIGPFEEIDAH
ncbi:hypothetical protein D3C80_1207510 [compost metagenome]